MSYRRLAVGDADDARHRGQGQAGRTAGRQHSSRATRSRMLLFAVLAVASPPTAAAAAADGPKLCSAASPCAIGSFCNFVNYKTGAGGQCVECAACAKCGSCGLPPPGVTSCTAACAAGNNTKPYNVSFRVPVALGNSTAFTATEFSASAGGGRVLVSLGGSKIAVSADGGSSYTRMDVGPQTIANGSDFGGVELLPTASGSYPDLKYDTAKRHDLGSQSSSIVPGPGNTSFSSNVSWSWAWAADNKSVSVTQSALSAPVVFEGLPKPALRGLSCDSTGGGGFRLQGSGHVIFGSGAIVQTASVVWGGNPDFPCAASTVAFISRDGGRRFTYQGTVADTAHYKWSQEGPGNEHDLALIDFGQLFCVLRVDGGDGPKSHPRLPYYWSTSLDEGVSWSPLTVLNGTGSARPRYIRIPAAAVGSLRNPCCSSLK